MKNVALYDPYLDIMGGGERHILSILQVLEKEGYHVSIFWNSDVTDELKKKLNLSFQERPTFLPNTLHKDLSRFDYFFYVTDGSYFFSRAKKTFIFCMYPKRELYRMNFLNRIKTLSNCFIANSEFTRAHLARWNVNANVIYPFVADDLLATTPLEKRQPVILSVGRFFRQLHAKKQEEIIDAFLRFKKENPSNLTLILAGGLKDEDSDYFTFLKKKINKNNEIKLLPNVSYSELRDLYRTSMFYWHFAGLGVDEMKEPYAVEHLGITPLEAMATGNITFAYNAGGPKELIKTGKNGFLFSSIDELLLQTKSVMNDEKMTKVVRKNAYEFVRKNFSRTVFEQRVKKIILV